MYAEGDLVIFEKRKGIFIGYMQEDKNTALIEPLDDAGMYVRVDVKILIKG